MMMLFVCIPIIGLLACILYAGCNIWALSHGITNVNPLIWALRHIKESISAAILNMQITRSLATIRKKRQEMDDILNTVTMTRTDFCLDIKRNNPIESKTTKKLIINLNGSETELSIIADPKRRNTFRILDEMLADPSVHMHLLTHMDSEKMNTYDWLIIEQAILANDLNCTMESAEIPCPLDTKPIIKAPKKNKKASIYTITKNNK